MSEWVSRSLKISKASRFACLYGFSQYLNHMGLSSNHTIIPDSFSDYILTVESVLSDLSLQWDKLGHVNAPPIKPATVLSPKTNLLHYTALQWTLSSHQKPTHCTAVNSHQKPTQIRLVLATPIHCTTLQPSQYGNINSCSC